MQTRRLKSSRFAPRAFSLVELLIVIAVIGILSAIAVPALNPIRENARLNVNQRNAQALAATAGAAQAAGASLDLSSIQAAVSQLKQGVQGDGQFRTTTFQVAPFTPQQIEDFSPYLIISNNSLVYRDQ